MTNEQLAILLDGYCEQLQAAINRADADLPDGVVRLVDWEYVGDASVSSLGRLLSLPLTNPDDWKEVEAEAVLLDPLWGVLEEMREHVDTLLAKGKN